MKKTNQDLHKEKAINGYMPQLDALRAFAVAAVFVHHFFESEALPAGINSIPLGFLGVRLFFVLSGFLITGILLRSRDEVEDSGQRWFAIRQFYARRFLRIFPLYYFIVVVSYMLDLQPTREIIAWLLTYTFNIQVSLQGWFPENLAHFWTLSVEEQFYLVWPWLVLFAPKRSLLYIISGLILLGPLYRLVAVLQVWNEVAIYCATPSSMDTLGMGSLLALLCHPKIAVSVNIRILAKYSLILGLVLSIVMNLLLHINIDWKVYVILFDTSVGLIFIWLVYVASQGFSGIWGRLLEWKPIVYCGKISYGLYVYHLFIPIILTLIFEALDLNYPHHGIFTFLTASAATICVASLSWYIMERPLNNFKRYFEYPSKQRHKST